MYRPAQFSFFVRMGERDAEGPCYGHLRRRLALLHDFVEVVGDLGHVDDPEALFGGEITVVEHRRQCAAGTGGDCHGLERPSGHAGLSDSADSVHLLKLAFGLRRMATHVTIGCRQERRETGRWRAFRCATF